MSNEMKQIDSTIKVKWYSTIFLLVGTILAFADPVTDILTLREFYLNDHKTWFGVGLVFVILPSLIISCIYYYNSRVCWQNQMMQHQSTTFQILFLGGIPWRLLLRDLKHLLCASGTLRSYGMEN